VGNKFPGLLRRVQRGTVGLPWQIVIGQITMPICWITDDERQRVLAGR
jgi:hypothetical protein